MPSLLTRDKKRLIIVSNRLPFQLVREDSRVSIRESDGGLVSALKSYLENKVATSERFDSIIWIGSAEFSSQTWDKLDKKVLEKLAYAIHPIFLDKKVYSKFYNGFCNATLWPLFHYFPSFVEFDNETFLAYEEVNTIFARHILELLTPNDTLWIHDYQLMLVPGMIRSELPSVTIGFFLHIPFPSFELFRLLHRPWKEKIINGLLGADLVGFHTHEYVQYFLRSVQWIKGYDHKFRTILLPDRVVKAEMFPLGIDFDKFHQAIDQPEVVHERTMIANNFLDKKIIFSVDRLDYTKGITHRLSGFEHFLQRNPEWREKVTFILIVVPSRQIVSKYNERKKLIEEEIGRINGMYSTLGWQPIIYRYSNLNFVELMAMYTAADIALITPLRDGMNLVAKEYLASRKDNGVLILSELAGAANELGESILVNPMDREEVSHSIQLALIMPPDEQRQKINQLQKRLKEYTVNQWVDDFLKQLHEVKDEQVTQQTRHLSGNLYHEVIEKYKQAHSRLLLLDYDGTLVPYSRHPLAAIPSSNLIGLLGQLATNPTTDLTIISGRDSQSLDNWFSELPVNLVSEHGAGVRIKNGNWVHDPDIDQSWKEFVRPVLEVFTKRSPGSFIEDKLHTLVWHYRNVGAELGFIRSRELLDSLHHLTRNANLHIIDGNKVIEVRVSGIDKGVIAKKLSEDGQYDFIMAIGDDKTDEDMFRVLTDKAITLKVGAGHTAAQYFLTNQQEVLELLTKLSFN